MGGWGSGRPGWRPVVEDGLSLDFGFIRRMRGNAGSLSWSRGGERIASIGWGLDLAARVLVLNYAVGEERRPIEQRIRLTTTRPHFGGVRWWMICPATGRRVAKLYKYGSCDYFVSRVALGMAYRSQSEDAMDRALRRGRRLVSKLGRQDASLEEAPYLPKPKWMRWRTYEQTMAKVRSADAAWGAAFCVRAAPLLGVDF